MQLQPEFGTLSLAALSHLQTCFKHSACPSPFSSLPPLCHSVSLQLWQHLCVWLCCHGSCSSLSASCSMLVNALIGSQTNFALSLWSKISRCTSCMASAWMTACCQVDGQALQTLIFQVYLDMSALFFLDVNEYLEIKSLDVIVRSFMTLVHNAAMWTCSSWMYSSMLLYEFSLANLRASSRLHLTISTSLMVRSSSLR